MNIVYDAQKNTVSLGGKVIIDNFFCGPELDGPAMLIIDIISKQITPQEAYILMLKSSTECKP